jgi:hypothetical protein
MKKYSLVLVPFLFSTCVSHFFATTEPNPDAPYGRDWVFDYLSQAWFAIGLTLSALVLSISAIHDIFEFCARIAKSAFQKYDLMTLQ